MENRVGSSYKEKQEKCERFYRKAVDEYGEFWHVCTPGHASQIINTCTDDYRFAVSNMAISAAETEVVLVTDAVMSNHIHCLLAGTKLQCVEFVDVFRYREKKYHQSKGNAIDTSCLLCRDPILINDLEMMRREIVYMNRNGFVTNAHYLPYSYPWGAGSLYFNTYAKDVRGAVPYEKIPFRQKRTLTFRRVVEMPSGYLFRDGMITPSSYARVDIGEGMFRDAHHYFSMLTKQLESYSELAKRMKDTVFLADEEMYSVVKSLCVRLFHMETPSLLSMDQKTEIARRMHFDFNARNNQIRRTLGLPLNYIDTLFPSTL